MLRAHFPCELLSAQSIRKLPEPRRLPKEATGQRDSTEKSLMTYEESPKTAFMRGKH